MTGSTFQDESRRLAACVQRAAARARLSGRPTIASVVERLPSLDPLAVMDAMTGVATSAAAQTAWGAEPHMYWHRPADQFALAALGAVTVLSSTGARRFDHVAREWDGLVADAEVDDESRGASGTGVLLVGGGAFDDEGPRTDLWRGFAAAQLALPRVVVTSVAGECWLTTNVLVQPDGALDVPLRVLTDLRAEITDLASLTQRTAPDTTPERDDAALNCIDARPANDWRALVAHAVREIRDGGFEKVVVARAVHTVDDDAFDVVRALRHLREAHPDTFVFGCWRGDRAFIGATPERLIRLEGRDVRASSLAGSAARGSTMETDAAQAAWLLASEKDRREHAVVLRTLREVLGELCDRVRAADEPSILTLPHMHHLHTVVRARLHEGRSLLELVGRLHPTPAVGGAPREPALAFLRANEQLDRGWYAAPVGWMQHDRGEFAVALRSALVHGNSATLFAGCGVVRDSDPDREYEESVLKLRPMTAALRAAQATDLAGSAAAIADRAR